MEEGRTFLRNSPRRIAYLVSQYPAVSHTFILREIRSLRERGLEIRVVSIRGPDRPFDQLTPEEQEEQRSTFYIKPAGVAAALAANVRMLLRHPGAFATTFWYALRLGGVRYLLYFAEAAVLADWMRRERLEQVHMHFTTTVGLLASRLWSMKCSATIHGSDEFIDPTGFHMARKVAAFDAICTISEYGRKQVTRFSDSRHAGKAHVVRLGVDPDLYSPRAFRYNPARFEILSVGRLAAVKGFPVMIAAMDRLIHSKREVTLRIAGDGLERSTLEAEVARRGLTGRVIFEGWQTPEQLLSLYAQADIFALASFAEGIPVVLMEAMAMEIVCVATWITGIPELIRHESEGLLVEAGDDEALACALARLMDDSDLRLRLGNSGRQRVLQHYNLRTNMAAMAELLQRL
ncbi:MAG TPA: glycosyltransferase [Bryobacteraceae bacterium]|nr:glycosyltransferase [Bryobacteraceae bacterium]